MRHSICISSACKIFGFTRQAYYKPESKSVEITEKLLSQILPYVITARKKRPTKGCRSIYEDRSQNWPIGRDKSVALLINSGFGVRYPKRYGRATQSGNRDFGNLLVNKTVTNINQVWQSDMAHYIIGDKRFYTIYITDVFSQEIVGHGAYVGNQAENYQEVLIRAIKSQKTSVRGLIHHSDGGKQYESSIYKDTCKKHGIKQSMCMYSYENPYAEKTNDLINNGYLYCWKPTSLNDVRLKQSKAVKDHNLNSKKKRLNRKSPIEFRNLLSNKLDNIIQPLELKPRNPEQPRNKVLTLIN
jgi:transposase InsO family protein